MNGFLSFLIMGSVLLNCGGNAKNKPIDSKKSDTIGSNVSNLKKPEVSVNLKDYDSLIYMSKQELRSGSGTKSVIFNDEMNKLYALNLEGMSIYEYSQKTKSIQRIFKFKATPGTGWDYETERPISSFQEKPVEACITNNDSILWVSLHNAEGIVPIFIYNGAQMVHTPQKPTDKLVYITDSEDKVLDSTYVPLIVTGKTPKVITKSPDDKTILVSNWHSNSISVLEIKSNQYPFANIIATVPVTAIPRGMVYDEKNKKSYVAIMGGASISVIDNTTWKISGDLSVASNPRHLIQDDKGRLFVSYNKLASIACIDPITQKTLFTASTSAQPRTIAISRNKKFLFVTCYKGDKIEVFKINDKSFDKIASLDCSGSPVGIDIFEDNDKLEAWACAYNGGVLTVYSFNKSGVK